MVVGFTRLRTRNPLRTVSTRCLQRPIGAGKIGQANAM